MIRWLPLLLAGVALAATAEYQSTLAEYRKARVAALQADGGWLTVAGLFWLHPGANRFGTDASGDIVLPDGPARAGVFELRDGKVTVTMDGQSRSLDNPRDFASVGRLSLFVIKRSDRYGIRMKDPQSDLLRNFHGLAYFPTDEAWRVTARWVADAKKIPILNVLGQTEPQNNPGYAVFKIKGKEYRLYPILEGANSKQLFFIMRDLTTGKETYPAGRFLYSELPKDGTVVLDFNKAQNPPCAFTPYATCPLPPKENHLPVRVEAGEKVYH